MGPYLYHCISRVIPLVLVISSLSQLNLLRVYWNYWESTDDSE